MWNELECYKNHFLQSQLPKVRAEAINRTVKKEMKLVRNSRDDCEFTGEVQCTHSTYFKDRTQLAYGFYALPKLMREVGSDNSDIRWRAINTLSEFLLNPLNAEKAITEADIVRRIFNIFMRFRLKYHEPVKYEIILLVRIFNILSNYLSAALQIVERIHLLEHFYTMILKKECQQHEIAKVLRNLSEKPKVLLKLIELKKPFQWLTNIFTADACTQKYPLPLWVHLTHFIEIIPEKAIRFDLFEMCLKRIMGHLPQYHGQNMKCFALMLRCPEGQLRFDNIDGVKMLYDIMKDPKQHFDTTEFIVEALLNGLHSKRALWRCREFTDLPNILMSYIIKESSNDNVQLYCYKTLRQMGEMLCIKRYMRNNLLYSLETLKCGSAEIECIRREFVTWLNRDKCDIHEEIL